MRRQSPRRRGHKKEALDIPRECSRRINHGGKAPQEIIGKSSVDNETAGNRRGRFSVAAGPTLKPTLDGTPVRQINRRSADRFNVWLIHEWAPSGCGTIKSSNMWVVWRVKKKNKKKLSVSSTRQGMSQQRYHSNAFPCDERNSNTHKSFRMTSIWIIIIIMWH